MACTVSVGNEIPKDLNMTVYQGGTFSQVIIWTDGDDVPVNLTGFTAVMKVKSGTVTLLNLNTTDQGITLGTTNGTITLSVDAEDTTALPAPANCIYDLILTSSGGIAYPLVAGLLNIRAGVSVD